MFTQKTSISTPSNTDALDTANVIITPYDHFSSQKGNDAAKDIYKGTFVITGILAADDVFVIGIADDFLIPIVFTFGSIAAESVRGYHAFAKSKKGEESARQKDVKHKGDGEGVKGKSAKGNKHTDPRSGRESTKNRQSKKWKKYK